jgi:hypothetical protein
MERIDFNLDVDASDVDGDEEYDNYQIKSLTVDEDKKRVLTAHYTYSWHCGDYCCSDTSEGDCYAGNLADWVKNRILVELSGYTFGYDS